MSKCPKDTSNTPLFAKAYGRKTKKDKKAEASKGKKNAKKTQAFAEAHAEPETRGCSKELMIAEDTGPHCCRSGNCCRVILMSLSPASMRRAYKDWFDRTQYALQHQGKVPPMEDVHLIWPMLAGTCRGKWTNPVDGAVRYVYGPCKFLRVERKMVPLTFSPDTRTEVEQACCTIHHHRPRMCSRYPYYDRPVEARMCAEGTTLNPAYMRGCRYNEEKLAGFAVDDFRDEMLRPLAADEQE